MRILAGDATLGDGAERSLRDVGGIDAVVHAALRRQASDVLVDLEAVDSLQGVTEQDFTTMLSANAWASLAGKTRGGDYAYCASRAARGMAVRALAADLARDGITVAALNPGNYKSDLEGPAYLHDVMTAADGVTDVLASLAPPDAGSWRDWTGALRDGWS